MRCRAWVSLLTQARLTTAKKCTTKSAARAKLLIRSSLLIFCRSRCRPRLALHDFICYLHFRRLATFGGSLPSDDWNVYSTWALQKIKSQTVWNEYFLKKGLWIGMSEIIIINKPRISVAFNLFRISIISVIFSTFGGWLFSGGSLLSGFANTCDILSLLLEDRYFRGVCYFWDFME